MSSNGTSPRPDFDRRRKADTDHRLHLPHCLRTVANCSDEAAPDEQKKTSTFAGSGKRNYRGCGPATTRPQARPNGSTHIQITADRC